MILSLAPDTFIIVSWNLISKYQDVRTYSNPFLQARYRPCNLVFIVGENMASFKEVQYLPSSSPAQLAEQTKQTEKRGGIFLFFCFYNLIFMDKWWEASTSQPPGEVSQLRIVYLKVSV